MQASELIEKTRAASDVDPAWLGSDEHLKLLAEFVSSRVRGTPVAWIGSGARSFTEADTVSLERPTSIPGYDVIRIHGAMALHELLHAVYTDSDGAAAMRASLSLYTPYLRDLGEQLFQWLEDARMAVCEHAAHPRNDEYVSELHRLSVEQQEQFYAHQLNEHPWTPTPTHPIAQLRMALAERILVGNRGSLMAPLVVQVTGEVVPIIDAAVSAAETDGARQGALRIVEVIDRHWPELNPPSAASSR